MSRRRYLVAYDIGDPHRLRSVHSTMKGFGDPLQYSVFICDLSVQEQFGMIQDLGDLIHHAEDRVVIVDLGQLEADPSSRFRFLGRTSLLPRTGPRVL